MRRWVAALLIVLLGRTVVWPDIAHTSTITLSACREVIREDLGAIGTRVTVTRCASEFSVTDPHIVLFASIVGVDYEQDAAVELADPDTVSVMRATFVLRPEPGEPTSFTFAAILPVAAPPGEVAANTHECPSSEFLASQCEIEQVSGRGKSRSAVVHRRQ